MKKAYTLIEIIFVIVIIGILAGVASSSFKSNYLERDADFITAKIKQAQYKGIGYDHKVFGTDVSPLDYAHGCINLEKTALEDKASEGKVAYKLRVNAFDAGILCFDAKGRPHDNDFSLNSLRTSRKVITLSYNGKTKDITVFSQSGFTTLECN